MADKMWDILRFLKNPGEEAAPENLLPQESQIEKDKINNRLADALSKAEKAVDAALEQEEDRDAGVSEGEKLFLNEAPSSDTSRSHPAQEEKTGVSTLSENPAERIKQQDILAENTPPLGHPGNVGERLHAFANSRAMPPSDAPVDTVEKPQELPPSPPPRTVLWSSAPVSTVEKQQERSLPPHTMPPPSEDRAEEQQELSPARTMPPPSVPPEDIEEKPQEHPLPPAVLSPSVSEDTEEKPRELSPLRTAQSPSVPEDTGEKMQELLLSQITPNPFQPRRLMGEEEIIELSDSIKELGVLQPILVKRAGSGYELIAGERRFRAAQRAGLEKIPAMVMETDPLNQQIIALVENIQRKNLSAIEEAHCLQDILAKTGWSQTELAKRMGRSQAAVANKIRLLKLDESVQDLVVSGKLGERQARSLLGLSVDEQGELAQKAIAEDLSARVLETLSETWQSKPGSRKRTSKKDKSVPNGPAGELLHALASLINKHRNQGIPAQWRVKQMDQSSLIVEISVDLNRDKGQYGLNKDTEAMN